MVPFPPVQHMLLATQHLVITHHKFATYRTSSTFHSFITSGYIHDLIFTTCEQTGYPDLKQVCWVPGYVTILFSSRTEKRESESITPFWPWQLDTRSTGSRMKEKSNDVVHELRPCFRFHFWYCAFLRFSEKCNLSLRLLQCFCESDILCF